MAEELKTAQSAVETIINVGGVFSAGAVFGGAIAVVLTRILTKTYFSKTTDASWIELTNSLRAEIQRHCARNRKLEDELNKIKKEVRR